ncbi:hypothetical protein HAX54_032245 [Datura stramonium]|uniref:Uncharacterized protein n=1 Tax=Datura stramonium TaxID=4076 RepID=A0ABS8RLG0_DATST|nr:hypothetical protein [Datura stramonium]
MLIRKTMMLLLSSPYCSPRAEIKMYKNEIAALQEDTRSLERHTRSKEAALLEAERILKSALERALIVEEIQNQNFELRRQIEIFQEKTKYLIRRTVKRFLRSGKAKLNYYRA